MVRDDIWYHVYPLGFLGAEPHNPAPGTHGGTVSHRLRDLVGWLDGTVDLGFGGLLLGPVGESQSHGYDVVDPFQVDRRLGNEADFGHLVDECRRRSLRVALDVVLNHVGRGHPHFVDVLARHRDSPWQDWFLIDFDRPGYDGFAYETFEGHGELVKLNHHNSEVLDWAVDLACCWIRRGVDAFRLDAAYAIPTSFLAKFADRVREENPDVLLLGEMIHGDYVSFIESSHLDTVTQYELWKAIWSSLNDENFFELAHALERHRDFAQQFISWNFLGNHDTTRIATRLKDRRHLPHTLAVLMTVPGVTAIYAGDEQGAEGTKYDREGGDQEIRRPPPLEPEALLKDPPAIWRLHQQLIAMRRQRPWLATGKLTVNHLTNRLISYQITSGDDRIVVTLNTDDAPSPCHVSDKMRPIAGSFAEDPQQLPPHGWGIWCKE